MRDASSRSSAVDSAHPSPRDETQESPPPEPEQSGDATIVMDNAPVSNEPDKPSDTNGADAPESQPMAKSESSSSTPSAKDAVTDGMPTAIPYGTRSRNRTGNPRPNYAEDREIDLELEIVPSTQQSNARKNKVAEPSTATDVARPTATSRKGPNYEVEQSPQVQSHHKEPIPGTSSFSANPAIASQPNGHNVSNGSKKRKAANQPSIAQQQQQMTFPNLNPHTVTRGSHTAAQGNGGVQDSNMLTFDTCQGRPTGGTLVSDDGTVLKVNGWSYNFQRIHLQL